MARKAEEKKSMGEGNKAGKHSGGGGRSQGEKSADKGGARQEPHAKSDRGDHKSQRNRAK